MKKLLSGALMAGTLAIGCLGQMNPAEALTFDLSCSIVGGNCTNIPSYGTLTLENSGLDKVQLSIKLKNGTHKILNLSLNYNNQNFDNDSKFVTNTILEGGKNATVENFQVNENGVSAGSIGGFDLQFPEPPPGNIGATGSFSTLISLTSGNKTLRAADFNFTNVKSLFGAVHIGNIGANGNDSIWVGAQQPGTPIPTPALLPSAIGMGIAALRRKKREQGLEEVPQEA